jgi:hypothetical protein
MSPASPSWRRGGARELNVRARRSKLSNPICAAPMVSAIYLALELGERQQHVERQAPHGGRRIELLRHRHERRIVSFTRAASVLICA